MADITLYVTDRVGVKHTIVAPDDMGLNLMEICKASELPVEGTCGGMALCASCQVYVESNHQLPDMTEAEEMMLDSAFFVKRNSRLGCQIHISEAIEGLEVTLAPHVEL